MYCTEDDVRRVLGLDIDDVSDETLKKYIEDAQKDVLNDMSKHIIDDELVGNINGSNTTFELTHKFMADSNYDGSINSLDVTVYRWGTSGSLDTRVESTVSTIYPEYGTLVLTAAPASTFSEVTATYYYYPSYVDISMISKPCAIQAAYQYFGREVLFWPENWMHGAYRFRLNPERMMKWLENEYQKSLTRIMGKRWGKTEHSPPTLIRRSGPI